jgi:hypothetical protein
MGNPYISRTDVHAWSEQIAETPELHQSALVRLLKTQRRLTRFIEENSTDMQPATAGISQYMVGVCTRLFDMAGGTLRGATWQQVRTAQAKIQAAVSDLLPLDDDFPTRARAADRAQPHILDEALMALFETPVTSDEEEPEPSELLKIYLLMWVAIEVLDHNWTAPRNFDGPTEYEYFHIEPKKPEAAEAEE